MDPNALYYTFSTIAQTLAAGFAILVAFVLYRLQFVDAGYKGHLQGLAILKHCGISSLDTLRILRDSGVSGIIEKVRSYEEANRTTLGSIDSIKESCELVLDCLLRRQVLVARMQESMAPTVITIGLCFLLLPLVPVISWTVWLFVPALVLVVGLAVWTLRSLVGLIMELSQ